MTTCIVCGCYEFRPCISATGEVCQWVEVSPGVFDIDGGGLCSSCAGEIADDPEFIADNAELHAALERGLLKPTDAERDAPLVELATDYEADLFIRERRARGAGA